MTTITSDRSLARMMAIELGGVAREPAQGRGRRRPPARLAPPDDCLARLRSHSLPEELDDPDDELEDEPDDDPEELDDPDDDPDDELECESDEDPLLESLVDE